MIRHISALAALVALSLSSVACVGAEDTNQVEETSQDLVSESRALESAKFDTFQGANGQFYFNFVAGNGEVVLSSEAYTSRAAMENGIASVLANGNDKRNFSILESTDGQWYFMLSAANGEVIGMSEMYPSKSNAERGADTVRALVRIEQQKAAR